MLLVQARLKFSAGRADGPWQATTRRPPASERLWQVDKHHTNFEPEHGSALHRAAIDSSRLTSLLAWGAAGFLFPAVGQSLMHAPAASYSKIRVLC